MAQCGLVRKKNTYWGSVIFSNLGSMVFGVSLLLITGLFVSIIIGDSIIISGIRNEKKYLRKTEEEIVSEKEELETHASRFGGYQRIN